MSINWKRAASLIGVTAAALFAVALVSCQPQQQPQAVSPGLLDSLDKGELRVGYGVYPPYTQEDPNTKQVSGFSVDVMNEIGRQLNVKVVWRRFNWNTMAADLKRGDFDVIADPIFLTIPRAREFSFSTPYAYFADLIPVVRKGDDRFKQFSDLGRKGIRIAVGKGFAAETILRARLPQANVISVPVSSDLLQLYNMVLSGRADVAVNDAADAERFVNEHPTEVTALWLDNPPAYSPAGFAVRPGDVTGARFLDVALENLRATGVLDSLAEKYGIKTLKRAGGQ